MLVGAHFIEASTTTDWIGAMSTAVLGGLGALLAWSQWHLSQFSPKIKAEVEPNYDAVRVEIANRGRMGGLIDRVVVTDKDQLVLPFDVTIEGITGDFQPTELPAGSAMRLILMAPSGKKFGATDRVKVSWGGKSKNATLLPVDVGIYGLKSALPPRR